MLRNIIRARTISSNFGFAFASSSFPSSSDATPTREVQQLPAKRRKTIVQNEIRAEEHVEAEATDVTKIAKIVKARRPLSIKDEHAERKQDDVMDDDSFIVGLNRKRTAKRKAKEALSQSTNIPAPVDVEKQKAVTRPRKQQESGSAALKGAGPVVDVIEQMTEETLNVNHTKKPRATRKRDVPAQAQRERTSEETVQLDHNLESTTKIAPRRRAAGWAPGARNTKAVEQEIAEQTLRQISPKRPDHAEVTEEDDIAPPSNAKSKPSSTSRAKKSTTKAKNSTTTSSKEPQHAAKKGEPERAQSPQDVQMPSKRRLPLVQTDANIIMRARTSEKLSKEDTSAAPSPPRNASGRRSKDTSKTKAKTRTQRSNYKVCPDTGNPAKCSGEQSLPDSKELVQAVDAEDRERTTSRRRSPKPSTQGSNKKHDEAVTSGKSRRKRMEDRGDQELAPSGSSEARSDSDVLHKVGTASCKVSTSVEQTSAIVQPVDEAKQAAKAPKAPSSKKATESNKMEDDDLDWLLAPQVQAVAPKAIAAKPRTMTSNSKTSRKKALPDIDLDDLLSNIAAFASEKAQPGRALASNIDLFHDSKQKARGGRQKART